MNIVIRLTLCACLVGCVSQSLAARPTPEQPQMRKPSVHGHRGARALRPENTLPAFAYALDVGVDVLELDLAVTKDNVLVVSHDLYANPVICTRADGSELPERWLLREHTLAEVKELDCGSKQNPRFPKQETRPGTKMPTLDEVFALVRERGDSKVMFNIETKIKPAYPEWTPSPKDYASLVVDTFRKNGMLSRIYLQSFDHRTLREAKALAPELRRVQLTSDNLVDFVALARAEGAHISPDHTWITHDDVRAIQDAGFEVIPWTANEPAEWQRLVDFGVDAIITDDPAALIGWLEARGLR